MRKWRVIGAALLFALIVIIALGFFAAPPLLKPILEERLSTALGRKVTIGRLAINPLALSATAGDVTIGERSGDGRLMTLDELYVNAEASSLFRWAPVISELRVTHPAFHLLRGTDNRYNVSDLLDRPPSDPSAPPPRFSVSNIRVIDGRIDFDDRPEQQKHEITGITIGVPFLSSLPVDTEIEVVPTVAALVNGRPITISGETRPFKDTHETLLHWHAEALPLSRYLEYVPGELPVRVTDGTLDAQVDLRYIARGKDPAQLTLAGTARLAGLALQLPTGAPLMRVPSASITLDKLDVTTGRAEVRSVAIEGAELHVERASSGGVNLAALAPREPATPRTGPPLQFHVGSIALRNGTVHVADDAVSPRFVASLKDVTLDVADLASEPGRTAKISAAFTTDAGERFRHDGTLGLQPLVAAGRLEIAGIKLQRLLPYYGSALNLAVDDGVLDAGADVRFAAADAGVTLANLAATARELKMRLPDEKQLLWRMPELKVSGGAVDVPKQSILFDSVEAHGAAVNVRRDAQGRFNFARLVKTPAGGVKEGGTGEEWRVEARKVLIDGLAATFVDETVKPPVTVALTNVVATDDNLSNASKVKGRVNVRATVNRKGALSLSGPLGTAPFAGTLDVQARDIDLTPFQPYVSPLSNIMLTGGALSLRGTLDFATGGAARAGFKGDARLSDVVSVEASTQTDLVKWKTLSLGRIDASVAPLAVTLDDIAADGLYARLLLDENGELNLHRLAREPVATAPAASSAAPAPATTSEANAAPGAGVPWLRIGKGSVTNGNLDFTDHFIRPNYSANITQLTGSLSTLTPEQPGDIELRGKVQDAAPVEITGRVNPLAQKLFLDLRATATGIDLPPLTPYSAKYVGYGIEKGKLSMKVHYLVEERKITAENSIILDQLTFGPKVESPDATKLPVLLAVSLLKDRNGVINFDLPVGGSLDDPQFSVGGLVFRALGNLIGKMVTAPFALLGKLGGHNEDLAYVEFKPGSASLDTAGEARVDALGKALVERPALKLDIAGRADAGADGEALKRAALERRIRAQKLDDLGKSREPAGGVDAVQVAPEEYEALLTRLYRAGDAGKPRTTDPAKPPSRGEMEAALLAQAQVGDEELRQLAARRAEIVRARLADGAHVPSERMFVVAPKLDAEGAKGTRAEFALH
jgi:hypothetical protein